MGIRRVVTGHDKAGRSIIVSDELAEPIEAGDLGETYVFWSADELPSFPNNGQDPQARIVHRSLADLRAVRGRWRHLPFPSS